MVFPFCAGNVRNLNFFDLIIPKNMLFGYNDRLFKKYETIYAMLMLVAFGSLHGGMKSKRRRFR